MFGDILRRATIDTGATRSFMNAEFAQHVARYTKQVTLRLTVIMANGSNYEAKEGRELELRCGGNTHKLTVILIPNATDDVVLGMDFLTLSNSRIYCAGQEVDLREGAVRNTRTICSLTRAISPVERPPPDVSPSLQIQAFLDEELPKFNDLRGTTHLGEHKITMKDDNPIKQRYTPPNPAMLAAINQEIDALINQGCIEPSMSPHSSPIVLVKKKTGQWRLCIDFRQINAKSIPDAYPLPRIQSILDRLRGAQFISTLDLKNGYWQVPMESQSKQYTAFTVPGRGLFQWRVMPFGLHSAPATFQRILDRVIGPELEPFAFAYLDDIVVIGRTLDEHRKNLKIVFERLRQANLRINPDKCEFFKDQLRYLGHVISQSSLNAQLVHIEDKK